MLKAFIWVVCQNVWCYVMVYKILLTLVNKVNPSIISFHSQKVILQTYLLTKIGSVSFQFYYIPEKERRREKKSSNKIVFQAKQLKY